MDAVRGREITVLGGGIAGLAAALALRLRGAEVTVMERAAELGEVGAGLQISPNGMRVLNALGVGRALKASGSLQTSAVVLRDYMNGDAVVRMDLPFDPGFWLVHRADLIAVLAEAARAAGVHIRLLQHVASVEVDGTGKPAIRCRNGAMVAPDLLVGADGLNSPTRRAVLDGAGLQEQPFFTGQVAWRCLIPGRADDPAEATVFMGPGRHLVSYPLRDGALRNIVAVEERSGWTEEGWHNQDDPTRLQRSFSGFSPQVRGWLAEAREVYLWGLFRHPVPDVWHRGRAVLIGDAVHPTLPFLAQGANMALEDAWVLAEALDAHTTPGAAFASYQKARNSRVRKIVNAANTNAWAYHLRPGPFRSMAHLALSLGERVRPGIALKRFDWVYHEDVTNGAEATEFQYS